MRDERAQEAVAIPSAASSIGSSHGRPFDLHCCFTGCKAVPCPGTPLCCNHLAQLKIRPKQQTDSSAHKNGLAPATAKPSSSTALRDHDGPPYLRRKTAQKVQLPLRTTSPVAESSRSNGRVGLASGNAAQNGLSKKRSRAEFQSDARDGTDGSVSSRLRNIPGSNGTDDLAISASTRWGGNVEANGSGKRQREAPAASNGTDSSQLASSSLPNGKQKQKEPIRSNGNMNSGVEDWLDFDRGKQSPPDADDGSQQRPSTSSKLIELVGSENMNDLIMNDLIMNDLLMNDLAYARLPIPSTPLRISSLRRDYSRYAGRRDSEQLVSGRPRSFSLDAYIYSQDVAALPPPEVSKAEIAAVKTAVEATRRTRRPFSSSHDIYLYTHVDPRTHWTRPRPAEWHEAKQEEIKGRGGRKANMGKAAERMAQQRRQEQEQQEQQQEQNNTNYTNGDGLDNAPVNGTHGAATPSAAAAADPIPSSSLTSPGAAWDRELGPEIKKNEPWMRVLDRLAQDETERNQKPSRQKGRRG